MKHLPHRVLERYGVAVALVLAELPRTTVPFGRPPDPRQDCLGELPASRARPSGTGRRRAA